MPGLLGSFTQSHFKRWVWVNISEDLLLLDPFLDRTDCLFLLLRRGVCARTRVWRPEVKPCVPSLWHCPPWQCLSLACNSPNRRGWLVSDPAEASVFTRLGLQAHTTIYPCFLKWVLEIKLRYSCLYRSSLQVKYIPFLMLFKLRKKSHVQMIVKYGDTYMYIL